MPLSTLTNLVFASAMALVDPATLGPAVGQPMPGFEARDTTGRLRDFASLVGPNGLMLVFFRSADW